MSPVRNAKVAWFATKGTGTNEALRIQTLLSNFQNAIELPFCKTAKLASLIALIERIRQQRPDLLVMEGTGVAGGLACILSKILWKIPYVFSSGDAVAPFISAHFPIAGPAAAVYEWVLCRWSSGFIGWTPYLCGRAMAFGAGRAVTAPGWVLSGNRAFDDAAIAADLKERWGLPRATIVVGILGALDWNAHRQYCYGLELVRCAHRIQRKDVSFLIVGDGTGTWSLRKEAGDLLGTRIFMPGSVSPEHVIPALLAMDVASLPQSMDGVGLFRYTTKISEYAEAGLPVITSRIPMAYDLGDDWMWRLPGTGPWTGAYVDALSSLLETLDREQINVRKRAIPKPLDAFRKESQIQRITHFVEEILNDRP